MSDRRVDQTVGISNGGALSLGLLMAVAAGPFLSMIDSNVVTVAIPDIAKGLHTSTAATQWTLSGYLLALAVALPATTFLAARYGTVRIYLASLAGFTLASAACAAAPSIGVLVTLRVVQGAVAAPLLPLAMALLYSRQGAANSSLVGALLFFLAPGLGPTIGGMLVQVGDWRLIFLINVPIGAAAALIALRHRRALPADHTDRAARLDALGLVLLAAGLGLLVYASGAAPEAGWTAPNIWPLWAAGAVLVAAYTYCARHRASPAVRLDLLARLRTAVPLALTILAAVVLFGVLFILPVFLQDQARYSVLDTGLILLPQGLAMGASTWVGQKAATRLGPRVTIAVGLVVLTASTAVLAAVVAASTPAWVTAVILTGRGTAIGLVLTPLLDVLLLPLPQEDMADASTLFNICQRLGGSVGIAVLGSLYAAREHSRITAALHRLGLPAAAASHPPAAAAHAVAHAATGGLHDTLWILVALAAIGLIVIPTLPRHSLPTSDAAA